MSRTGALWQRLRGSGAFGRVSRLASAAALAQGIHLAAAPFLTRWFDVAQIGAWTLFAATAATLGTLATARYEYAIVLPRRHADASHVLQLCMAVCAAVTLATALGVLALLALAPQATPVQTLGATWAWLPVAVAAAGFTQALTLWHNRLGGFGAIARARILGPVAVVGLQALAAVARWGTPGLVAAQALGVLAPPLSLWWATRGSPHRRLPRWSWRRLRRTAWQHRRFPLINTPHAFVNALQETLAIATVAALAGVVAAGHFGLTMRLLRAPASLVGGAVSEVLLSPLARTWNDGGEIRPMLWRATRALGLVSLVPAALLLFGGPALFGWMLGDQWQVAGEYARWLVPYLMAHFIVGPLTIAPIVMNRQGTALSFSLVGNALYVVALAAVLWAGGSLPHALGVLSVVQVLYFAAYWRWLWSAARRPEATHA